VGHSLQQQVYHCHWAHRCRWQRTPIHFCSAFRLYAATHTRKLPVRRHRTLARTSVGGICRIVARWPAGQKLSSTCKYVAPGNKGATPPLATKRYTSPFQAGGQATAYFEIRLSPLDFNLATTVQLRVRNKTPALWQPVQLRKPENTLSAGSLTFNAG